MDPITTAIVVALAAGVASGTKEVGKGVIVDAYTALKEALKHKCGVDSKVIKAVENLEEEPDFEPNQIALQGRMEQAQVTDNPAIVDAAENLTEALKSQPQVVETAGFKVTDLEAASLKLRNIKASGPGATAVGGKNWKIDGAIDIDTVGADSGPKA